MELLIESVVAAVVLSGHAVIWIALANRWHSTGFSRPTVKFWTWVSRLILCGLPLVCLRVGGWRLWSSQGLAAWPTTLPTQLVGGYAVLCVAVAAFHYPRWLYQKLCSRPARFLSSSERTLDMARELEKPPLGGPVVRLLAGIPGNQILSLRIVEHRLEIPRLPPQLDGLSLVHLTDLHFSGRITPAYFHEAVRQINQWDVDLLLLTGDVCEKEKLIPWVREILGSMHAKHGKYFILGNHDLRTRNVPLLRSELAGAGFLDVSGVWRTLSLGGARIVIGGDERPWFRVPLDPRQVPPAEPGTPDLRLMLMHSPDCLPVARAADVDLALAGHTHGGQICLPWIGPIVCPSWYGIQYAAGLFHEPPTKLYVGRGTSGLTPLRFFCPPELTRLELHAPRPRTELNDQRRFAARHDGASTSFAYMHAKCYIATVSQCRIARGQSPILVRHWIAMIAVFEVSKLLTVVGIVAGLLFVAVVLGVLITWRGKRLTLAQHVLLLTNMLFVRGLWRTTTSGPFPVAPGAGAIIVSNHCSSVEPLLLQRCTDRIVFWMVAREYVENGPTGVVFRAMGCIPVGRRGIIPLPRNQPSGSHSRAIWWACFPRGGSTRPARSCCQGGRARRWWPSRPACRSCPVMFTELPTTAKCSARFSCGPASG